MKKIIICTITIMTLMSGLVMAESQGYKNRDNRNHGQNTYDNHRGDYNGHYRNDDRRANRGHDYGRYDHRRGDRDRWYGNRTHRSGFSIGIHYNYNNNYKGYSRNERRIMNEIRKNETHITMMERDLRILLDEHSSWNHRYNRRLEKKIRDLRWNIENLREENRRLWRLLNRY